jgi:hypothetical protein
MDVKKINYYLQDLYGGIVMDVKKLTTIYDVGVTYLKWPYVS